MSQNNSLDCFSCKELKNQIVSHEKSATRSIEITVRSDSIRDNMILIVKNVPSSALSSKASNRKQIGTKYLQQPVGNGVCFFFFMPDRTDLFGLNFCSGHSEVVTAHKESLRTPVQLYSGLILLCEIEL